MRVREQIRTDLKGILAKLGFPEIEPFLGHPAEAHGDYATNVALVLGKAQKAKFERQKLKTPLGLAKEIAKSYLLGPRSFLEKIEVAPPGFLNFWLKKETLCKELEKVLKEGETYGRTDFAQRKKVMVEFAHPNTHKPFHIGHLRNITLGESIVRLLEFGGPKVIRANYQGDVGLHIAKCLWGIKKNLQSKIANLRSLNLEEKIEILGKAYVRGAKAYDLDPKARKEIEEFNQKIYQKLPAVKDLWEKTRNWSLKYFARIYKRVDSYFDRYYFESEVADLGKKIVLESLKKGIFEESDGAIIFPGRKYGLHHRVFLTRQGLPTYEAKDLALAKLQFQEFDPDLIIHLVGPEQKGYFEVVFKALEEIFPKTQGKECHLLYGWVRLKTGKMSSRTGEVVLGEWLLEEVEKRLRKRFKMEGEIAETVAVGAVKYSFLKVSPWQDIVFDIEESINLEGNSGPYLQYTYARIQSVLKKSQILNLPHRPASRGEQAGLKSQIASKLKVGKQKLEEEESLILRSVYRFPEIAREAAQKYSPNLVCAYLFNLSQKFNLFYQKYPILKVGGEKREFRLKLTRAVGQIIRNGLFLLGIGAPERM